MKRQNKKPNASDQSSRTEQTLYLLAAAASEASKLAAEMHAGLAGADTGRVRCARIDSLILKVQHLVRHGWAHESASRPKRVHHCRVDIDARAVVREICWHFDSGGWPQDLLYPYAEDLIVASCNDGATRFFLTKHAAGYSDDETYWVCAVDELPLTLNPQHRCVLGVVLDTPAASEPVVVRAK